MIDVITKLQREYSELAERLIETRAMLSYDYHWMMGLERYPDLLSDELKARLAEQKKMLDGGLFGDKN